MIGLWREPQIFPALCLAQTGGDFYMLVHMSNIQQRTIVFIDGQNVYMTASSGVLLASVSTAGLPSVAIRPIRSHASRSIAHEPEP